MASDVLSIVLIVGWVLLAVGVGLTARKRQRRFWPWFVVGLILSFLFAMVALGIAEFLRGLRRRAQKKSGRRNLRSQAINRPSKRPSIFGAAKTISHWVLGLGGWVLALGGLAILVGIGIAITYGVVWMSSKLYPFVEALAGLGFVAFVLNLLPSAIFRGSRRYCGKGIVIVSYIWGVALWMYSILALYDLWGLTGILLGFYTLGVVTVPLACLALLFKGEWSLLAQVIVWGVVVFATRALGYWIISKGVQAGTGFESSSEEPLIETGLNDIPELRAKVNELMNELGMDEATQENIRLDILLRKRSEEEVIGLLEAELKKKQATSFDEWIDSIGEP